MRRKIYVQASLPNLYFRSADGVLSIPGYTFEKVGRDCLTSKRLLNFNRRMHGMTQVGSSTRVDNPFSSRHNLLPFNRHCRRLSSTLGSLTKLSQGHSLKDGSIVLAKIAPVCSSSKPCTSLSIIVHSGFFECTSDARAGSAHVRHVFR